MKIQKTIFLNYILLIIFFSQIVYAQDGVKENCLNHYTENFLINTDRDLFVAGEKIFFNVDCSTNKEGKPLISKVLYLELIDLNNKTSVYKGKFKIVGNNVNGNIIIPKNIYSGLYAIRAYTQWNRNFNHLDKNDKYVSIINPQNVNSTNFISDKKKIKIVPSSNILLNNTSNNVTVFIPEDFNKFNSFQICKDKTFFKKIQTEKCFYTYNGIFSDSSKYFLLQLSQSGDSIYYPFPEVKRNGIIVNIKKNSTLITYQITNINLLKNKKLHLKIYSEKNLLLLNKVLYIGDTISKYHIKTDILKPGINYFILSNTKDKTLNISCLYNRIKTTENITINTNKNIYSTREFVNVELNLNQNLSFKANISVILKGTDQFDYHFNPDYLFQNRNLLIEYLNISKNLSDKEIEQILILYQSYLNNKQDIYVPKKDSIYSNQFITPDVRGVSLTGYVKDKKTLKPISNIRVSLSSFKSSPQFHIANTDKNGRFIFSLNRYYGKNDLFICTEKPNMYNIYINNPYEEHLYTDNNYSVFFNSDSKEILKDLYQNAQIHNTFTKNNIETNRNTLFNIQANFKKYNLEDYIQFKSLIETITEIIPEIHIKINKNGTYLFILFDSEGNRLPGHPLILFDYIPVYNLSKILNSNFSAIKQIDVLNQPYVLGNNILNGIILIHSNNKDLSSIDLSDTGYFLKYDGFQISNNETFLINYKETTPDFKNTLFWAPDITVNKTENKFSFKTSDNTGTYKIIVKGYDVEGNYIYSTKYIRVTKKK